MKLEIFSTLDYHRFKPFFANQRYELCEYCLPTIMAWLTPEYQPRIATCDTTLIMAGIYPERAEFDHLLLPISPEVEYRPAALVPLLEKVGLCRFWFVPESYLERYGREEILRFFSIKEQKDYSDYVYRTADLSQLQGNRYAKKRNLINQFSKEYVEPGRVVTEVISAANCEECIDFIEKWCLARDCAGQAEIWMSCEKEAAINGVKNIGLVESNGLLLRIDGEVSAFAVISPLTADMAVMQFEKAFEHFKGLYQYLDRECCARIPAQFTFLNKESDMGIPGLAQSKKSYLPCRRLKSFELTLL